MARNSVALNLGDAGEQPGASRVAEFLACCLSELVWSGPYNPYVQKTPAPSPARVLRWGRGRKGGRGFQQSSYFTRLYLRLIATGGKFETGKTIHLWGLFGSRAAERPA